MPPATNMGIPMARQQGAALSWRRRYNPSRATVVALSRGEQRDPAPTAATRVEAGDLLALTGSGRAIGLAAALLLARDTSSPPSGMAASVPPGA